MTKKVIIPSALLIHHELQLEFGKISSAMIPLNGKPILDLISKKYIENEYDVIVIGNRDDDQLRSYVANKERFSYVPISNTKSLKDTINQALIYVGYPDVLAINFADTYIDWRFFDDELDDTLFFKNQSDVFRWTTFQMKEGRLISIEEKNNEKVLQKSNVFVGAFIIKKAERFHELLRSANDDLSYDGFYDAIMNYFNESNFKSLVEPDWLDFGHIDTYYKAKREIGINQREFNSISIDTKRAILTKKSKDEEKFINEIKWYRKLPKEFKYLTPRIFEYSTKEDPILKQEYYSYPVLMDLYLYADLGPSVWMNIFESLKEIHDDLSSYSDGCNLTKIDLEEMYSSKTKNRLNKILDDVKFSDFKYSLEINGYECMGIKYIIKELDNVLDRIELYDDVRYGIIHGDLCLSNILYEQKNGIIKLIDPRGSFGKEGIFGDIRYDEAKLSHSLRGDYDFILNGLFDVKKKRNSDNGIIINYKTKIEPKHLKIKEIFESIFKSDIKIKTIESLLFLSMVPLHSDRPESQEIFLSKGIRLFNEVIEECK